jgi:ankyrin repeat protein
MISVNNYSVVNNEFKNFRQGIIKNSIPSLEIALCSLNSLEQKDKRRIINGFYNRKFVPNVFLAINWRLFKILKFLIENNADINFFYNIWGNPEVEGEYTPLMWVARTGNLQFADVLLKNGANIYLQNKKHENAIHYAKLNKNKNMVKMLEKKHKKNKDDLNFVLYSHDRFSKLDEYLINHIIEFVYYL